MVFALRHPQLVEKLVLNSANLNTGGVKLRYQLFIEAGYRLVKLLRAPMEKVEMLGLMVDNPDVSPQELEGIKAKTLVIAGTRDMIKTEHSRLIAKSIPDARLCLLPGGHGLVRERAEEYNREVLGFLLGET